MRSGIKNCVTSSPTNERMSHNLHENQNGITMPGLYLCTDVFFLILAINMPLVPVALGKNLRVCGMDPMTAGESLNEGIGTTSASDS